MEFWQEERWWLVTMENGEKMLQVFFFLSATSNAFGKSMSPFFLSFSETYNINKLVWLDDQIF